MMKENLLAAVLLAAAPAAAQAMRLASEGPGPQKESDDKFVNDAVAAVKDGVTDEIIAFLKNWLVNHIKVSDMGYVGKI